MRDLLDNSPIGIAIVSSTTLDRLFVNPSLARMFGAASAESLLNQSVQESWLDPRRFQAFKDILDAGENLVDFEAQRLRHDGSVWWVLMNSHSAEFEGQTARAIWHNDITETVKARAIIEQSNAELEQRVSARTHALERSEEKLRIYSDVASDWFWEMGPDLRFTYISERAEAMTGVSAAFQIGKTRADIAGEDATTDKWRQHLRDLADHKPFHDFRYNRKGPDGSLQYLSVSGTSVFDGEGQFKGYIGIGSDVTDQIEAADQVKIANERLAAAIHAFSEPFALWGPDDRLLIANHAFREVNKALGDKMRTGVSYLEFARALIDLDVVPDAVGRQEDWLRERIHLHHNPGEAFEQQRNASLWFLIYEQRFADGSIATISTDITRLKQTEARLKESQTRFRDFAEVAAEWFWEQDADLRFVDISFENLDETDLPFVDYHGKKRWELEYTDVSEATMAAHRKQVEAHQPFYDFRVARLNGDNRKIYRSISGKPIFDEQGRFTGYRGAGRDITDIVEAQKSIISERDRAEKANRAKSEFLANMSHELRTPLNSILGYAQMIKDEMIGKLGSPKYVEYANDIFSSGQHLLLVISDILDISKVEAGEITIDEQDIILRETMEATLLIVDLLGQSKAQTITVRTAPDLPKLRADDRLVRQILINLLSNAIKFTPAAGQITVTADLAADGSLQIRVKDTGVGIAEKDIQRALEPFGQIRGSSALAHEGTGLGLSLSKSLTELHDGTLTIESQVNRGTVVTLSFPNERVIIA
ncbi:MAG: PAS domain S-box protein [Rhodospirillales bacterium]|nr:PAS domain S-box protein [Rhodospirillales bacterium]